LNKSLLMSSVLTYLCRIIHYEYGGHHRAQGHMIADDKSVFRDAVLVYAVGNEEQNQ